MGPTRSKIKKSRKSIIKSPNGESRYYTYAAVLGICIAGLPWLVAASQHSQQGPVGPVGPKVDFDGDLEASNSQTIGVVHNAQRAQAQRAQVQRAQAQRAQGQRTQVQRSHAQQQPSQVSPNSVPTSPVPVAVAPPPSSPLSVAPPPPSTFTIPKTDLASAPSYAPRYAVAPVDPWRERLPYEVQAFRRRAADDDGNAPEDDYQPQESKGGKKHSPSVFKRVRNSIRNTGKAIVGAPSYILKKYRGTWKKYWGGGKKKKGGWKAWSPADKNDGWAGWEEVEPTGGYYEEPSHYPSDKGWKSSKGYSKGYDSHERRRDSDRESTGYRDYRDRDTSRDRDNRDYDAPPSRPYRYRSERGSDRPKYNTSYREETHYDDYDGRRTTAYYGSSGKKSSSKRPSSGSRYDDEY